MLVGEQIRKFRNRYGLSQEALAKRAGIGRVTLARIELGIQDPTVGTLERLARALGVELRGFFPAARRRRKRP